MSVEKEHMQEWVAALRSDKYLQTEATLVDLISGSGEEVARPGYCCLGVGCVVGDPDNEWNWRGSDLPPDDFFKWLGLIDKDESIMNEDPHIDFPEGLLARDERRALRDFVSCSMLNDSFHLTFSQIADLVDYFGVYAIREGA